MKNITTQILNYLSKQSNMKTVREIEADIHIDDSTLANNLYILHNHGTVIRTKRDKRYQYGINQSADNINEMHLDDIDENIDDIDDELKTVCLAELLEGSISDVLIEVIEDLVSA